MNDCIFCKISKGDAPSSKVYEDDDVFAFLDIAPSTKKGHVLVIPKEHYVNMLDIPAEKMGAVFNAVKKIATALKKEADGVSVEVSNGKAAGQIIQHLHVHVIPRFEGDGLPFGHWEQQKFKDNEIQEVCEKIKKLLNES